MTQKNRSELKELFKTGAKPSQQDFADFIESTLNIKDDGIENPSGANTPLKITAQDTDEKLLDFYAGETKTWSINQKPGENKIGLNISNSGGSKLFIDSNNGNVGLSIDQPTAKLHIQQTGNEDALRIDDELKDTTPFLIDKNGNVGIGTTNPSVKLEVSGDLKVNGKITGTIDTANITSGILSVNRIPNLPANKITSGTISEDLTVSKSLSFGASTRQMINLWNQNYGIGIQGSTQYFRTDRNFAWYKGGTHNDAELSAGTNGTVQMVIRDGNVGIGTSDPGSYKLTVEGNQHIKGTLTITNTLSVAASAGSTTNIDLSGHVQLKEYSTQNLAYFQARDDSSNRDIGLRIRTQKKGDSKASLVEAITINSEGNVGIGTTNPTKGKVEINGYVTYQDPRGYRYFVNRDDSGKTTTGYNAPYSLYASNFIGASEFNAFSDKRIKEVKGVSDSTSDLKTLLRINITDYTYKDKVANDNKPYKKVIGQQLAEVFPQAVKTHTDVVPDIFQPASIAENWVSLPGHGLQAGERVRILLESREPEICTVEAATPDRFQIFLNYQGEVFVYGREVNDFHVVDYDALAMLHISATQELCKIIDALKTEVQQIKAQLHASDHPLPVFSNP